MAITKRQVFYSFHYRPDCWRASQIRNIGTVEGNKPAADNDWESITSAGDDAIKKWIDDQMEYRSCVIVLIGSETANRKWINYEIKKAWRNGKGVAGIYIHGLKNSEGKTSEKGTNPFYYIDYNDNKKLSEIAKCYNPEGYDSKKIYDWISTYMSAVVEEAIKIRDNS